MKQHIIILPKVSDSGNAIAQSNTTPPSKSYKNPFIDDKGRINLMTRIKKSVPRPNREGLKLLRGIESSPITTYPRKCNTDEQKFECLAQWFINNRIDEPMFIEFADVLKFQHPLWIDKEEELIADAIETKLRHLLFPSPTKSTPTMEENQK